MLNELATDIHNWAHSKGFWISGNGECEGDCAAHVSGSALAVLMLVVSELGEAAEAYRHNDSVNFAEEIADTIIRLLDMCKGYGIDIDAEVREKMNRNRERPHLHGKQC